MKREFPYGVPELAEALGIQPASVRVALRNAEVEKAGKTYGWKNQKDFQAVVKQLKASGKDEEKPAKKAPKKKAAEADEGDDE